jgi:hypothetical protein
MANKLVPLKKDANGDWIYQDTTGAPITIGQTETTVLLELYKDNILQGRHHETQRSNITTIFFAFVGGLLGLAIKDGSVGFSNRWLFVLISAISGMGVILSYKQYERVEYHTGRARFFRRALNSPKLRIEDILDQSKSDSGAKWLLKRTQDIRLHHIWIVLFIFLMVVSAGLAFAAWHQAPIHKWIGIFFRNAGIQGRAKSNQALPAILFTAARNSIRPNRQSRPRIGAVATACRTASWNTMIPGSFQVVTISQIHRSRFPR